MREVIYVDVIFFENLFINFLLLYAANRFCRCKAKIWRLIAASSIGALYVFVIFFPNLHVFYSILMKFLVSLLMIIIAFSPYKIKTFIKITIIFYIEAFTIGGCMVGVYYLRQQNVDLWGNAPIKNISPGFLVTCTLISIILVKLGFDFFENYYKVEKNKIELQIILDKRICNLKALIDTGNSLKDPLTNSPVIIVYFKALYDILPDDLKTGVPIDTNFDDIMKSIVNSTLKPRIRLIPYKALGVENGLLTGIKVDMVITKTKFKTGIINNPIIALYSKPISNNNDYQALAYPEILKEDY